VDWHESSDDAIRKGEPPYPIRRRITGAPSDIDIESISGGTSGAAFKHVVRLLMPAVGSFLLGVFPGMNWLERFAATSPVFLGSGTQVCLILLLASSGALAGILLFRLVTWTEPIRTDAAIIVTYALVFGFVGFLYLLTLVV
jgi:hypothetical protein